MSFVLDVSRALKYPGQTYRFEADIEPQEYEISGDTVMLKGIHVNGDFFSGEGIVSVRGDVTCTVAAVCDRCLKAFEFEQSARLDAEFAAGGSDDPDIYPLDAHSITLDDPAKDALLLELPIKFLCSESCKGLCPKCGHDLNLGPCTCQEGNTGSLFGIEFES